MESLESGRKAQDQAAEKRVKERAKERKRKSKLIGEGALAEADDPKRVATRIDRLSRFYSDVRPVDASALAAKDPDAMTEAGKLLERVINSADFLGVAYLEAGVAAENAVGRINVRDERGRLAGYGTGSLVSPQLLLTNHHVLPDEQTAAVSIVEFNYEDDSQGRIREARPFELDPQRFFLTDEDLDFALVALKATGDELAVFGFNRLMREEGKAIVGDFVTVVQHPRGDKKQVALRENRIVDLPDKFLHYSTDTEPGSSGSPVFNDQWEVVALHHASARAPQHEELGGIVNEGIRVSRLADFITNQDLTPDRKALVDEMLSQQTISAPGAMTPANSTGPTGLTLAPETRIAGDSVRLEVPVEITVRAGGVAADVGPQLEAITIDPDYSTRAGYDPTFLGGGELEVPLPALSEDLLKLAALNTEATEEPRHVLDYHHYSVVHNKERRLAFLTAVNVDGATHFRQSLKRESDRWYFDPRIPEDQQAGEEVYASNPLDRGHLVRRLDPGWGESAELAKAATDDTFHFTNCTPQHERFNQNRSTWAGLEDYVLYNADNFDFKTSIFTGPVFAEDDDEYQGIALPRQYWKVAVMVKEEGELSATGYLLSQDELIQDLPVVPEAFSYGAYKTFQVPITQIQELTKLDFGPLVDSDPLSQPGEEALGPPKEITRPQDLVL